MNIDYDDFENRVEVIDKEEIRKTVFWVKFLNRMTIIGIVVATIAATVYNISNMNSKTGLTSSAIPRVLDKTELITSAEVLKADVERQAAASFYYLYLLDGTDIVKINVNMSTYALADVGDSISMLVTKSSSNDSAEAFYGTVYANDESADCAALRDYLITHIVHTDDVYTITMKSLKQDNAYVTVYCNDVEIGKALSVGAVIDCDVTSINDKYTIRTLTWEYYLPINSTLPIVQGSGS